ncbi:MAG TPA: family 1 glycosylhydrolase [Burkholderiaceae bacterium]|jgi:dTDP-4-dehydrorhamnose reductase|nr:family 1 glycosylhydrolase [Burkholderiaceae bacterium]
MASLQLWAGPECTVNRLGDRYRDQLELTGFAHRLDDLDRLAELGIQCLRFPLLWERTAPKAPGQYEWDWSDKRLDRLRSLQLTPIVGLMHHGSGPRYTNLLDSRFPYLLAEYARAVAERYPRVDAYTPVNEPVTTARFSALYGLWYPHRRDDRSFVRAVLNQMLGTALAMKEIRKVNPGARLVQTDDLGYTSAPPHLRYQADFENARRWLSFDLLTGRVIPGHPLWRYLIHNGASRRELASFSEQPCPPDIVGINCYVTSERFLDSRLSLYPLDRRHGNRRHRYVDVESVRVLGPLIGGFEARLREASKRYALPVAVTEAHMGCTRDEQLRWLYQAWKSAEKLRSEGIDVRAVTAWATFGTVDWNSLLTREERHYEAGLWDVSGGKPRQTALATLARQLAHRVTPDHPALSGVGWWQRDVRLSYPPLGKVTALPAAGQSLLITGATGTLGKAFARICAARGLPAQVLTRAEMDIATRESVDAALERWRPWAVINTAGFVRVDAAEHEPRQWRENVIGPAILARACALRGVKLLNFSSDLVFDGDKPTPYVESDAPRPLNAYGRSKLEAERRVQKLSPDALVIRTAAFFGPWDRHNFVAQAVHALQRGERWRAANDQLVSPTYVPDLVQAALNLLIDGERGLWHLTNHGAVSWSGFAQMVAEAAGLNVGLIDAVPGAALGQIAMRPRYSALQSERGLTLACLQDAVEQYLTEVESDPSHQDELLNSAPDATQLRASGSTKYLEASCVRTSDSIAA